MIEFPTVTLDQCAIEICTLECLGLPDFDDPETNESLNERLEWGHAWAWCDVRVRVRLSSAIGSAFPLYGDAYLGGCSYTSEAEFRAETMEYDGLVQEALADLDVTMKALAKTLNETYRAT